MLFFEDFDTPFDPLDDPLDPLTYLIFEDVTRDKDTDDWDNNLDEDDDDDDWYY